MTNNYEKDVMVALYNGEVPNIPALTYQEIGGLFGVSRQRVHQIIMGYTSHPSNEQTTDRTSNKQPGGVSIETSKTTPVVSL